MGVPFSQVWHVESGHEGERPGGFSVSEVTIHGGTFTSVGRDMTVNTTINNFNTVISAGSASEKLIGLGRNTFRAIQHDTSHKRVPGTATWLMKTALFKGWEEKLGSILWGTGMPGAGKTYLASAVIDYLLKRAEGDPTISVVFVYFRDSDPMSVTEVLAALVKQQAERSPAVAEIVAEVLQRHQQENTQPTQSDYLELLKTISKKFKSTFFVLDALDEASYDAQFDVIQAISSIEANFFITSRPLRFMQTVLEQALIERNLSFWNIVAQDSDIELLVTAKLNRIPVLRDAEDSLKIEIIQQIKAKANGMFLHAALQMEALQDCISLKDVRQTLNSFPERIDDLYSHTMNRIESQVKKKADLAKRIVLTLIHASRSLTLAELQYILATSLDTLEFNLDDVPSESMIISVCCGLITLDPKSMTVRLVHLTAKDALNRLLGSPAAQAHADIAKVCMSQLKAAGFHRWKYRHLHLRSLARELNSAPFLTYAHSNLSHHLEACDLAASNALPLALDFIEQCQSYPYYSDNLRWLSKEHVVSTVCGLSSVHVAVTLGLPLLFQQYISRGGIDRINQCAQGTSGMTPLMIAIDSGQTEIALWILDFPEVQATSNHPGDKIPLVAAAHLGQLAIVQRLMAFPDTDVNTATPEGTTALLAACQQGNLQVAQALVEHEAIEVNAQDKVGKTALMEVAKSGYPRILEVLLACSSIAVNTPDSSGTTPLMAACEKGDGEVVRLLLGAKGIDVNATKAHGVTALMVACDAEQVDIVEILLSAPGIDVNAADEEGRTALMIASGKGDPNLVRVFFGRQDVDIDARNQSGATALMIAAASGRVDKVKTLLDSNRADVNATNNRGETVLMLAARMLHHPVVELLLRLKGTDINARNEKGETVLMLAAKRGHHKIVRCLLACPQLDVNAADENGRTSLISAAQVGFQNVVKVLLASPTIDVNSQDQDGRTALINAVRLGKKDVVEELLLAKDIDRELRDHDALSALDYARSLKGFGPVLIDKILDLLQAKKPQLERGPAPTGIWAPGFSGVQDLRTTVEELIQEPEAHAGILFDVD